MWAGTLTFSLCLQLGLPVARRFRTRLAGLAVLSIANVTAWTVTTPGAGRRVVALDACRGGEVVVVAGGRYAHYVQTMGQNSSYLGSTGYSPGKIRAIAPADHDAAWADSRRSFPSTVAGTIFRCAADPPRRGAVSPG